VESAKDMVGFGRWKVKREKVTRVKVSVVESEKEGLKIAKKLTRVKITLRGKKKFEI